MSPEVLNPAQIRAAHALARAANAFISIDDAQLSLDEFHTDDLRSGCRRMLELMDPADAAVAVATSVEHGERVRRAARAIATVDIAQLNAESRAEFAGCIAGIHAQLVARHDHDVTRGLLDATPPGTELAALIFHTDPTLLDPDAQVSYCQAAQRLESATHSRLGAGLVAFAGSNPRHTQYWVEGDDLQLTDVRASELASALTWSGSRARDAITAARVLANDLDAVAEVAACGELQPAAITAIADGAQLLTASIDDAIADARSALAAGSDSDAEVSDRLWELTEARAALVQRFDGAVSGFAATHTVAETRRKVRDTLAKLDPDGFAARRARARELESGVEFRALPNAMAILTAVMPSEHATACFSAIDAAAREAIPPEANSPIGVRRSDAFYAFCVQSSPSEVPQGVEPRRSLDAHVDLVMTLESFLGLADTPADCVGAGPIPAQSARDLLAEAAVVSFRRVIVDDVTGRPLDISKGRYRLSETERDFIFMRDRTCRHPGCGQPARRCEIDHAVPFDEGGPTRADNLGALCSRHHLEKTHAGWQIESGTDDGSCVFVSPLGRRYERRTDGLLPWAFAAADPPGTWDSC